MLRLGTEVVIATRNAGKVKEFEAIFADKGIRVRSLLDYDGLQDIVEDGDTFAANALIKARVIAQCLHIPVVADDSGLCVDRLDGAPGVYSARYAGEGAGDEANNRKLLKELAEVAEPEAKADGITVLSPARFVCAIALVDSSGQPLAEVQGVCEGAIISEPRGAQGFGYDPLFYVPDKQLTMAELSMEEKNAISHRGRAIEALWRALETE
jgi:XTP/dITP diphosphohydrolase